jgi:hypothetical protein
MKYFFRTTDNLGTPNVVDARTGIFSNAESIEGYYCVDIDKYPEYFPNVEDERTKERRIVQRGLMEGWENLPLKTFDPETGQFADFDPYACEALQRWYRRDHVIQPSIVKAINPGTEYKKIRRAMLAILDALKDKKLEEHEDIIAFREYSASIEAFIDANPKSVKRDMREINGTKKKDKEGADGGL